MQLHFALFALFAVMVTPAVSHHYRPPQVPLEVENYPLAPAGLQLEQVQVFVRHGERTPVRVRMANSPASIPEHWNMCKTARQFKSAVFGTKDDYLEMRRGVERADGSTSEDICLLGELTDVGRQSTYKFGKALRELYIDKLGFLPDRLMNLSEVYFRSTNLPRTIDSLQQIIYGLYPNTKCDPGVIPTILIRNGKDENLFGNTVACKRLEKLLAHFADAAAAQHAPALQALDHRLFKFFDGQPLRVDSSPRASGVMDTVRAAIAHGMQVPPEFKDNTIVDVVERAVVDEWFSDKTEEVRRLGIGRLLGDVVLKMEQRISPLAASATAPKLLVHSTHDTAIAAICSTLDVFDHQWPAFTASVTFELFSKPEEESKSYLQTVLAPMYNYSRESEKYVRMRVQNQSMVLDFCAKEGDHLEGQPEFCTLKAFARRVKELTPIDFEKECRL